MRYGSLAALAGGALAVFLVAFLVFEQLSADGASARGQVSDATSAPSAALVDSTPSPSVVPPTQAATPTPPITPDASPTASATPPVATPSTTATPTTRPTATPRQATATPRPTPSPTPTAKPTAKATPKPTPKPTAKPTPKPDPTPIPPGTVLTVEIRGTDYVRLDESEGGTITKTGGSLIVETIRDVFFSTRIGYDVPAGAVPAGLTWSRIDMKLCGSASGDFWETYAPDGGDPFEQEVTQPESDGCWHFNGADGGDPYFECFVVGESRMRIDRIVYKLTVG